MVRRGFTNLESSNSVADYNLTACMRVIPYSSIMGFYLSCLGTHRDNCF